MPSQKKVAWARLEELNPSLVNNTTRKGRLRPKKFTYHFYTRDSVLREKKYWIYTFLMIGWLDWTPRSNSSPKSPSHYYSISLVSKAYISLKLLFHERLNHVSFFHQKEPCKLKLVKQQAVRYYIAKTFSIDIWEAWYRIHLSPMRQKRCTCTKTVWSSN